MRHASKKDISSLIDKPKDSKAISIFLPTHRISLPHNLRADRVRMKNAIRDVVAELENEKLSAEDIKKYVSELHKLRDDASFWKYRDNGLAIYVKKGDMTYFDLPIEIEYSVHIGEDFIISPLLASNRDSYQYYILELNNNEPRAFHATQSSIDRILDDEMPGELETALRIDEYQQRQQHSTSPGGSRDAHGHGHGGVNDNKKKDVIKYYRLIDKVLWDNSLKNSNLDLILIGDTSSAAEFRKLSKYKHIHDTEISGNYQHETAGNLHMLTWSLMVDKIEEEQTLFHKMFDAAKYRDNRQSLINGMHIRKAARQGRIATLGISIIHKTYDSVVRRMEQRFKIALPSSKRQLQNIEQTAREVLATGGEIKSLLRSENSPDNLQYIKAITR